MAAASLPLAALLDIPTFWIFAWIALCAATIAIVMLLRTRFRHAKPWQKCAILSLWVHVLLACATAAVRIVAGGPGVGPGYGPPIQVALLDADLTPITLASEPLPMAANRVESESPDVEPPLEVDETPVPEEEKVVDAAPLEAPELLPQPKPEEPAVDEPLAPPAMEEKSDASEEMVVETPDESTPSPPPTPTPAPLEEVIPPVGAMVADSAARSPSNAAAPSAADAKSSAMSVSTSAPLPAPYAARFAANRDEIVASGGGNARTERSVRAALAWLAAAQSPDGRWDAKRHGAGQERYTLGQDRGGAGAKADTGVSGLALLAFLGDGHSHREGPYVVNVGHGLEFLSRAQRRDGNLCGDAELFAQMYCHSMASFAASEAFALTRDERLAPMVRAAANYSLAVQHPTDGGWRYRPGDTGDTSQLGWQVMALRSAELCGVEAPAATWTRVDRFLRSVERGQAGGLAVYRAEEARPTRPMTAEALYCRQLVTGRADGQLSRAALDEAIDSLLSETPSTTPVNLYYWYYATLALHRAQHVSPESAEAWRRWNDALTHTLLATQGEDGSWPATCIWAGYGGRVFTTSLAAMCLEVYYRYAPTDSAVDPQDVAHRPDWQSVPSR